MACTQFPARFASPKQFAGSDEEDIEVFLLDFDLACEANGWYEAPHTHGEPSSRESDCTEENRSFVTLDQAGSACSAASYRSEFRDEAHKVERRLFESPADPAFWNLGLERKRYVSLAHFRQGLISIKRNS